MIKNYIFDTEQYFPTYNFLNKENRDIAIAEYVSANNTLENEEKFFTTSTNIAILAISLIGSFLLSSNQESLKKLLLLASNDFLLSVSLLFVNIMTTLALLIFFAQRQKEINFAARKVIVLRRLLGVTYGKVHMVLPTWRVEAADEPFAIKPFKGWLQYNNFPAYLISTCSSFLFVYFGSYKTSSSEALILFYLFHFLFLITLYRVFLFDHHENIYLIFAGFVSKLLGVHLVNNFEYVIYRSKLQTHEMGRLDVDCEKAFKVLIFLEDRRFFKHGGISYLSIGRAIYNFLLYRKRSGASTISQQLARTLFISHYRSPIRRKIVEIILSFWMEKAFFKQDILIMYIGAVRFERDVFGVLDAMKFFFGEIKKSPSVAEWFFLLERVSNINSKLLGGKLFINIRDACNCKLLSFSDIEELLKIYEQQIKMKKIVDDKFYSLSKLKKELKIFEGNTEVKT